MRLRRLLPAPVADRLIRSLQDIVHNELTVALRPIREELERLHTEVVRLRQDMDERTRDLLERDDTLIGAYDRRVAATASRLLRLEEVVHGVSVPADANLALASHVASHLSPELAVAFRAADPPDAAAVEAVAELVGDRAPVVSVGAGDGAIAQPAQGAASAGAAVLMLVAERLEVAQLDHLLRKVAALVRPAGVVIILALDPASAEGQQRFWRDPTRRRLYDPAVLGTLLAAAGFDVGERRSTGGGTYALVATRR